jgi:hypothetical protein
MASTKGSRQDWISETRQAARVFLSAVNKLREQRIAWDSGMGAWIVDATGDDPDVQGYEAHDFAGNEGLMKADMSAVIGTTLDALEGVLAAGNETNLQKVSS